MKSMYARSCGVLVLLLCISFISQANSLVTPSDSSKKKVVLLKEIDTDEESISVYRSYFRMKKGKKVLVELDQKKDQPLSGLEFRKATRDFLTENEYRDENRTVLVDKANTVYIKIDITRFRLYEVVRSKADRTTIVALQANLNMNIEIIDAFDEVLLERNYRSKSKTLSLGGNADYDEKKKEAFQEVLIASIKKVLKAADDLGYLEEGDNKPIEFESLRIQSPKTIVSDFEQAVESSVTISYEDGHGSGFFISSDGHILTNSHVINGQDDLEVILHDGSRLDAELIRENKIADLALIKVDKNVASSFKMPGGANFKIGKTVYAIGTPTSIELGQTISRGIISGFRKIGKSKLNLIQTDVPVNSGNSGGALITAEGELIGVVNSKVFGFGVEGISFAIPAHRVMELLGLEVQ